MGNFIIAGQRVDRPSAIPIDTQCEVEAHIWHYLYAVEERWGVNITSINIDRSENNRHIMNVKIEWEPKR